MLYCSFSYYCSVIVRLKQGGEREDPEEDNVLDEDVDKFCVELYQGSKLFGQKQIISKFCSQKRKHKLNEVRKKK